MPAPSSSNASMRTSPSSPDRLMTRTNPCTPPRMKRAAEGKKGTPCVVLSCSPAAINRKRRDIGEVTGRTCEKAHHLYGNGRGQPQSPLSRSHRQARRSALPLLRTRARAPSHARAAPPGSDSTTGSPGVTPRSSVPSTVTEAVSAPRLMRRRRLTLVGVFAWIEQDHIVDEPGGRNQIVKTGEETIPGAHVGPALRGRARS